ncbi:Putative amidase domain-containing protein [Paenibacillus sp. cl141a]|uniref:amidase domain-containing protein n=1 Tax=Paenibacillus sp. cl141a TaxID=1761877 RepID=UPI0008B3C3C1|nr:amidase domain-containing protein [Paenibacillus sp. cl141a]SEM69559.1 Putative amidase domain-containing protein [Paenibacillus sp. cl141a]
MIKTAYLSMFTTLILLFGSSPIANTNHSEEEIKRYLDELFAARSTFLVKPNSKMTKYYDQATRSSRNAFRVEEKRKTYLNTWGEHRGIHFTGSQSKIRVTRIQTEGDTAKVSLAHSQKLSYIYVDKVLPPQSFGIGTWHSLTLKKKGGSWIVLKEWYLDPLDENPKLIEGSIGDTVNFPLHNETIKDGQKYKRKKAVEYADKYAGTAWGAGNKGRYNPKYMNYNVKGGDCTNFASQVLGDQEEGGALQMKGPWRYRYGGGGTRTWVQTDAFKSFIIRSGYGEMIASGTFAELIKPTSKHPDTAFAKLLPGDLIAHVLNNDVDHFSVVTGFDDNGYPLVNSHTADRYRAPFDLGWDKHTHYILIHIND